MYPRRGRGYRFPQPPWYVNTSRETYGSWHNANFSHPYQDFEGARNMPDNRMYNAAFDNCRNSDRGHGSRFPRGHFRGKRPYRHRNFRGSKSNVSKGTFQELSHSSSYAKQNKKEDNSQKVKTQLPESKKTDSNKEVSLALKNKTCLPKVELKPGCESEGGDKQLCSARAVSPSPPGTVESLTHCKDKTEIDLVQVEVKDNGATEDPSNQIASMLSIDASTEEQFSEPTAGLPVIENGESMLLEVRQSPQCFSCFQSPPVVYPPFLCETANDHDHSEEKEETEMNVVILSLLELIQTQNTCNHEDTDHGQGSGASVDNYINSQHTLSNICCVPVLVRDTRNNLPQLWQSAALHAKELKRWAPEDCQDPPWSANQASKCGKVSGHDTELLPSESLSPTHSSCDQKCDTGRLIEWNHSYLPKSNCNCDSKHSGTNCIPKKLHIENSGSSCSQRYSPKSPCKQEHSSRSSHRQEHGSGSSYRREHGSGSPKNQQASISLQKQQQSSGSLHRQKHGSGSPHTKEHDSVSPHRGEHGSESFHMHKLFPQNQTLSSPERRRRNSHERGDHCSCHNKHSFSQSQKNSWDEKSKTHEMPHHYHPASPPVKRKWEKETELEEPTKKKTSLEHKMKFAKETQESSKIITSPSEFSFRLPDYPAHLQNKQEVPPNIKEEIESPEKQTSQGQVFIGHAAVPSLPEPAQSLPPVLQPVEKKEPELVPITANSENICSPCLSNVEEKTSSSEVRWTPEDYSAAVLARKEAIEEAYLQVLLNFAGVATMLVDKAPCMQAAMDSALRANLRRIGEYYERMFATYIDSLAEAS